jgi:hypothetical protein
LAQFNFFKLFNHSAADARAACADDGRFFDPGGHDGDGFDPRLAADQ